MKLEKDALWMQSPSAEEESIWKHQSYLCLIDLIFMIAGACIFVFIGNLIVGALIAFRG